MMKTARSKPKVIVWRKAMNRIGLVNPPNRQCARITTKSDQAPCFKINVHPLRRVYSYKDEN